MNIFDAWRTAEQRFRDGYACEPDLSDRADLTVVLGLLGEIIEEDDGRIATMFEDAAQRLSEREPADIESALDAVLGSIAEIRRDLQAMREAR